MNIEARLISRSRDGKTAEVVSCLGEGSQRRSVTSHVRLAKSGGGYWAGYNPNKAAVTRLNTAETAEAKASKVIAPLVEAVEKIEGEIFLLKNVRADAKAAGMDDEAAEKAYQKTRRALGKRHKEAVAKRDAELPAWQAAQDTANKLRAEVPRYLEFVF